MVGGAISEQEITEIETDKEEMTLLMWIGKTFMIM